MLRLRLRGPSGKQVTGSFDPMQSLGDFLADAGTRFGESTPLEMLTGFPPSLVAGDNITLVGSLLSSGASVTFRRAEPPLLPLPSSSPGGASDGSSPAPGPPVAAAPLPPTSATAWSCGACTLENTARMVTCAACETPRVTGGGGFSPQPSPGSGAQITTAVLEKMRDDNSCLFHGVAWLLDAQSSPAGMRQTIAAAVAGSPNRWNEATLGKPPREYVAFITDPTKWGGQVGVLPLARAD